MVRANKKLFVEVVLNYHKPNMRNLLVPFSGFAIEGPSQAKIECDDKNDGSCDVKYWPKEPGEYAVHIMCDDEDIKDSPYMAFIRPASGDFNADKVRHRSSLMA